MVTNYLNQCAYKYNRLKKHIYLYDNVKNIYIDHRDAYITGATGTPIVFSGFDISYAEQTSLDERYKFSKTLKISINGRLNKNDLPKNIYAIIENEDGTYFFTNPDFPYKLTYEYNLSNGVNQTDITLTSNSNLPTLELITSNKLPLTNVCKTYMYNGIKSLRLLEKENVKISTYSNEVITTEEWKTVEYLKNTCSLNENYDGNKITATIQFNIDFSSYKSDWQYRLLEFNHNRYTAALEANDGHIYYVGIINGLEANYNTSTTSQNGNSDVITINLVEMSDYGISDDILTETHDTSTSWVFTKYIDGIGKAYECWGMGTARYIIMAEVDAFGHSTGNYKMVEDVWDCLEEQDPYCIDTYGQFLQLNIIDTFEDSLDNRFPTSECIWHNPTNCVIETDMPAQIIFNAATSYTYSFKASCPWTIDDDDVPTGVTVSPLNGNADETYSIAVTNSLAPSTTLDGQISITCCEKKRYVGITVQQESDCIYPTTVSINCLSQPVQFAYNGNCLIEITAVTKDGQAYQGLTYQIANNQLVVNVPDNFTNNNTIYKLYVTNCGCKAGTTEITINQTRQYEMWMSNCSDAEDLQTCDYVCSGTSKYLKEYRYTGTTTDDWQPTGEYRMGELISTTSSDCSRLTRFSFLNHYICIDGSKYQLLEEEESLDGGVTWTTTGVAKLGDWVEDSSEFCQQTITYQWILTNNSICMPT